MQYSINSFFPTVRQDTSFCGQLYVTNLDVSAGTFLEETEQIFGNSSSVQSPGQLARCD